MYTNKGLDKQKYFFSKPSKTKIPAHKTEYPLDLGVKQAGSEVGHLFLTSGVTRRNA
jgi:hypothetical protein